MAFPTQSWNHNTFPSKGWMIPGVVMYAGTFTTDASGNVTSVSGIAPGMTVSGTSLSSGVYTVFFGDGPNVNQVGNGPNSFPGGRPKVLDSFNQVLFLHADVVENGTNPTDFLIHTSRRDGLAASGVLQVLKATQTTPIASGAYVTTGYKPALLPSSIVQVFAVIWADAGKVS